MKILPYFEHQKGTVTSSIHLFFLSKEIASEVYHLFLNIKGIKLTDDDPLKLVSIMFADKCSCSDRLDIFERDCYAKDIKIEGFRYSSTETSTELAHAFVEVTKFLNEPISFINFSIRRIQTTSTCIVSFRNRHIRDRVFFAYLRKIKELSTVGINNSFFKSVLSTGYILFNDHLSKSTRVIYNFCRQLKSNLFLSISTRRGVIAVKLISGGIWKVITSFGQLQLLLYPAK